MKNSLNSAQTVSRPRPWLGGTASSRIKVVSIVAILLAQLVCAMTMAVPGYLSIDDALYHWMTKSFHERAAFDLWNGYGEIASPELRHPYFVPRDGKLYPPHPYLFPILAAPFYHVAGYWGLFLINTLAYLGVAALCYATARLFFASKDFALDAVLVLTGATFLWEYTQAAWPHATGVLLVTAAFYAAARGWLGPAGKPAIALGACAGLIAGFAAGVRYDTFLVVPALVLPFLFARPWRLLEAIAVGIGLVPGLAILAWTNWLKFGTFRPFTYGQGTFEIIPPGASLYVFAAALGFAWLLSRGRVAEWSRNHVRLIASLLILAALGVGASCPDVIDTVGRVLRNSAVALVDIRLLDPLAKVLPGERTAGGAVIYSGAHKKALLQSLPYLTVLIVPLIAVFRQGQDAARIFVLFIAPATAIGYFSFAFQMQEAGGGVCLNQRYLLICLPFFAILTAYGLREVACGKSNALGPVAALVGALCTVAVFVVLTRFVFTTVRGLEFPLLTVPLLLASLVLLCVAARQIRVPAPPWLRRITCAALVIALTWAASVATLYDYPQHRRFRATNARVGQRVFNVVPNHSVFFAGRNFFTPSVVLIEKGDVRIAPTAYDRWRDFPRLLNYHLQKGRRAVAAFSNHRWALLKNGPLADKQVIPLDSFSRYTIAEIRAPGP